LCCCSKEKKLLKTLKFPKEFDLKVDFKAVNWEVMKTWIAKRVTELLGLEDEVVIGYIYEQLESKEVSVIRNPLPSHFL
jgi:serine/arginine repetitive matrix protein 1